MITFKIGLIINPYAGIGGSVGLKGSDGEEIRAEAFVRGAEMRATARMQRCLAMLQPFANELHVYCYAGDMGEVAAKDAGLDCSVIGQAQSVPSNAQDTQAAVAALVKESVDIILFAGGDGTARNVADALQQANAEQQVVLGVPSGVKMHSGVYAITPEGAGEILLCLLKKQWVNVRACDVRDIDEAAFREGKVKTRLYASMFAPVLPQFLQQVKNSGAAQDELVKLDIANYLLDNLIDDTLYIVGPGSTTNVFLEQLGVRGSLLGVDIILNRELIAADIGFAQLGALVDQHVGEIKLIITAIGGQGHIIGRGNQQLSADVLRNIGRHNIQVIATKEKILSLSGRPLLVDSNDPELDKLFSGYQSVLVGYDEFILYPIGIPEDLSEKSMKLLLDRITDLQQRLEVQPAIDSYRLLHGRGKCFDGLDFVNVDFFQPVLLLVFYKEPPENWLNQVVNYLQSRLSERLSCVLVQRRYLVNAPSEVVLGVLPEKNYARRGNLLFNLHLNAQQNSGFFLDMESGRQWVERNASGKRVLNLFAYTCAFSVVAVAAGAEKVVNVDMSSPALNLGRVNHQLNGFPKEKTEFVAENILKSWSRVKKPGPYEVVIIDPPSYQKGSFIAEKDYAKVIRRLPELMPQGGLVLACLNAPELSDEFLKNQFVEYLPSAEFVERLGSHPDFPDINPEQQLKLLVYRIS